MVRRGRSDLSKKQRGKVSKVCSITAIVIAVLVFILKEIVKDNLKDLHDSIAKAESQFRTESGQSVISYQILLSQEQAGGTHSSPRTSWVAYPLRFVLAKGGAGFGWPPFSGGCGF